MSHNRPVNEPLELHDNRYWRFAVWSLRVGYVALAIVGVGVIVLVTTSTPWVLAVGVIGWLGAAVVTVIRCTAGPPRAVRSAAGSLAHAIHAHPRHRPRQVVALAVLTPPATSTPSRRADPGLGSGAQNGTSGVGQLRVGRTTKQRAAGGGKQWTSSS